MDSVLLSGSSPTFGGWVPLGRAEQDAERRRGPDPAAAANGPAQERSSPEEDTSHAGRWLRYTSFVAALAVAMSATLFTVPVALIARLGSCPHGCFSLPKDLSSSLNGSVHPCDDFYGHVCSGWDNSARVRYLSALDMYSAKFSRTIIKSILLEHIPARSTTARGKAAGFIFRCLSRTEEENVTTFSAFLKELGLPWPSKSPATRSQLLDTLVRASLQLGMPMFWAFYVGRHPSRPSENTIYMTLDPRFSQWIRDIEALAADGKADDYLRRCAEIVGRTGQSYSLMIQQVMQTHSEVVELVRRFWGSGAVPQYYNLSDPDLRRAVNGYLPDDSQLWPVDEIVNLQPEFFEKFDATHLSQNGYQERFKLFLGAYVVWVLSPIVSRYLTTSMLVDMKHENSADDYRFFKCLEALETLMPLVKWQLHRDAQKNLEPTWNIVSLSARALSEWMSSYDRKMQKLGTSLLSRLATNAFNMTNTWQMLDSAFAYLPNDTQPPFFELYRRYAKATVTYFKQSLRRPQHSIYHVPGVASVLLYRVTVGREVTVPHFLASSPLFEPWYPASLLPALAGTLATAQMVSLLRFAMYYNSRFQAYGLKNISRTAPGVRALGDDVYRLEKVLNISGVLPDASKHEFRTVYEESVAAHTSIRVPDSPDWRRLSAGVKRAAAPPGSQPNPFSSYEPHQFFFYLACFKHCGGWARERDTKVALCNVALPASPRFRQAFKCGPQHRLFTDFMWPEPSEQPT
ncbi:hypothetical protein HPB49_019159 [Dermacentor silvarum]|uniref:Uncharacterized protein n=1 Tax=Dermacentor silvarum TaxID=543639 RepID=A0ACB8CZ46_DERSI|nr:hypothetical protein HPB49_019159 [Dermacentor silvarum]